MAGTIDYLTYTRFISRPGWLILFFYFSLNTLRNSFASAEVALWFMHKSKKLERRKFRRQYSIGSYIVDFCCPSKKLIIQLDGNPHGEYHKTKPPRPVSAFVL